MKHEIIIWSKDKKTGKNYRIEQHVEITFEEIEDMVTKQFINRYGKKKGRIYFAEIDKTIT